MIPGEKKLKRCCVLEEFLERAVVEILGALVGSVVARHLKECLSVLDAVVIHGDAGGFLVGIKKGEKRSARPHDAKQLGDSLLEERSGKKLQSVPDERAIERLIGKSERLIEKTLRLARGLLIFQKIVAERFHHSSDDVVGRDAMAETGDEADVGLAGAGKIEDRETFGGLKKRAELFEAAAMAGEGGWRVFTC